jgi:hypothetical protein
MVNSSNVLQQLCFIYGFSSASEFLNLDGIADHQEKLELLMRELIDSLHTIRDHKMPEFQPTHCPNCNTQYQDSLHY